MIQGEKKEGGKGRKGREGSPPPPEQPGEGSGARPRPRHFLKRSGGGLPGLQTSRRPRPPLRSLRVALVLTSLAMLSM